MKKAIAYITVPVLMAVLTMSAVHAQERLGKARSSVDAHDRSRAPFSVSTRGIQHEAKKLSSELRRSPELGQKLARAIDTKNERQVRDILVSAGIDREFANSSSIVMLASGGTCIGIYSVANEICYGIYIRRKEDKE
ncbi:MAG: hypothetical protein WD397_05605 [Wenzhouxiangellaceae bacterium]